MKILPEHIIQGSVNTSIKKSNLIFLRVQEGFLVLM